MKKFFILNLLLFISYTLFSQKIIRKGFIYSRESNFPISFATVQILKTSHIVDADENGYFEINSEEKNRSLFITSIGYTDTIIPFAYFKDGDTVFISPRYLRMEQVVIKNPVFKTFGIVNEKMGSSRYGGNEAGRTELTTLIEIPEHIQSYRICKIFIKGKEFSDENPVRLHLYSVNEKGLPGEELLKHQVIISKQTFNTKSNIITIDIKDQNIFLEHTSFFVGVQFLSSIKVKLFTGPEIIQTYQIPKVLSYYRQININKNFWWVEFKRSGKQVFKDGNLPAIGPPRKGNPSNMCASAEIEEYSN